MTKLRVGLLLLCLGAGALVGWAALQWLTSAGRLAPVLDYTALFSMGAVSVIVLVLGIRIKRSTSGSGHIDPIAAARTLVLAQAAAYAGAVIAGWHLPAVLMLWLASGSSPTLTRALVLGAGGVAMVIIGYIVQHLCKIPPEDPEENADGTVTE
ncbi:hypothetical protein GCM10027417_26370 [Glutamicibacter endophyticus]